VSAGPAVSGDTARVPRTLQEIVDGLGRRLGVPVTLEDQHMRLLVHNAHPDEVDPARQRIILNRRAPDWAMRWGRQHGLFDAHEPIRVPLDPGRGVTAPRVVVPIRSAGRLLGWIWVIEPDGGLDAAAMAEAAAAASEAATVLADAERRDRHVLAVRAEVVAGLLDADAGVRAAACDRARAEGVLQGGPVHVAVLRGGGGPVDRTGGVRSGAGLAVDEVAAAVRDAGPGLPADALQVLDDHGRVVVLTTASEGITASPGVLAATLAGVLDGRVGIVVGVSATHGDLAEAHVALTEAAGAARVAAADPRLGPVATWAAVGAYRALLAAPGPVDPALVHPGVAAALADDLDPELVETVEVLLDECGKAARAAEVLHVHRGTLYHRLKRFAERTGADLDDGHDRLAVHLALKAHRLAAVEV
jgi:hypothetical protein